MEASMSEATSDAIDSASDRPVVLRRGTVLTMDDRHTVLTEADVLVIGQRIEAVGVALPVPEGTLEIDATGGIVMPGMIDTHRHMWQTAMRGYGADWTLTQYFVWNYLEHGIKFRPEDIYAGNLLAGLEALEAGVTTTVDWSHGLQSRQHADAAADALEAVPGRWVLAYGNIHAAPWEWSAGKDFRDFVESRIRPGNDLLGFQMAFDVTGDPAFPEKAAFEVARDLGAAVTTHAGVWGATNDDGIRLMYENGFMTPETVYVHAATLSADSYQRIAATGGSVSVANLATALTRHRGLAVDGHQRLVERRPVLRDAQHSRRRPGPRASECARARRDGDQLPPAGRARGRLGHPGRGQGAGNGFPGGQSRSR
jgi:cytosine/adenosine deaminase-related metal-dependent hydrolase